MSYNDIDKWGDDDNDSNEVVNLDEILSESIEFDSDIYALNEAVDELKEIKSIQEDVKKNKGDKKKLYQCIESA